MIRNYFKIAWRNLIKNKGYSLINIIGMTIGMTCFILIALYIQYESSYDQQHENADQIYRVSQIQKGNVFRGSNRYAKAPMPLVPSLKEHFPEVQTGTTLAVHEALFSYKDQIFYEKGLFSDEHLFDVFNYQMIEGIGEEALKDPNAIILTVSLAKKYFGKESPMGKTLLFENERPFTVKGIVEDVPKNQHFTFDYITSFKNLPWYQRDVGRWYSNNYRAYVVLPVGYNPKELEAKLGVFDSYTNNHRFKPEFFLQPLKSIHLHSHINFELSSNSDIRYIYFSVSIAFIILLLALINYMNLATIRSAQQAKEVGMRKVLGAKRVQLVKQFMAEPILITIFSFVIAIGLAFLLLPSFNQLLDLQILYNLSSNRMIFVGMLSAAILLGGLSGLYPAVLTSTITPINSLKGGWFKIRKNGAFLSNALVVGQFTTAIILAIGSVVIYQQLQYIQNKKLGYNRDQVVYVPYRQVDIYEKTALLRSELLKHPKIEKISFATYLPLNMISQGILKKWEGNNDKKEIHIYQNYVDYNFLDLFEINLVEGRNFSREYPSDSTSSIILNESAVKALGWESAIGKSLKGRKVIGVVKDFHFQPFDLALEPLYLVLQTKRTSFYGNIAIKTKMDELDNTIAHIQKTFNTLIPQVPFEHRFMDESYNQLYGFEKRVGLAFNIFTLIALFIACMGLFGLVSNKVLQRTKEIGIRKVLGASVPHVVSLISKDFLKLIFLAIFIAIPIASWGMNKWLQDFAYRIEIRWTVFLITGLIAISIAFITLSFRIIKAAIANPIKSLKTE